MSATNYDDALSQLRAAGLIVDRLETGRLVRCRVIDDRERRGWYMLHLLRLDSGDDAIVGSFGVWRGNDNGATKIQLGKLPMSPDQSASVRKRLAEDKRRADLARRADAARAAHRAQSAWRKCDPTGDCEYLTRKGVLGHGVRYSPSGAMVVPMCDVTGVVHGLQIIRGRQPGSKPGRDKEYWPRGLSKKGHFHLVGLPTWVVLVAEGYATAASLYAATGLPVAVAFDAGNLPPVCAALHKRYPKIQILVCADDDAFTTGNPGVTAASAAALEVGGAFAVPRFANEAERQRLFSAKGVKLSDYNDLHQSEGLHVVRAQVEARLLELGWRSSSHRSARQSTGGEGADAPLRPIDSLDELLERYALVYGQGGTVFDRQEHCLVALGDMRDACQTRELHRGWAEHPDKKLVRVTEVGFDPACTDPAIQCNLWAGWPTQPESGGCEALLDLLRYMCGGDANPDGLYRWVLSWLAYPIQHPGAKMKTTLVIHGPQGTGKNLFFEAIMAIYGRYGRVIDQSAIEDKFNDWASRKLFLIADEVVARSDLYHVKNKLKAFITGDWIRINPKNMAAYEERNHANVVFLSNEAMPVVLEEDDRRHAVIWTPEKLSHDFYKNVRAEVAAGGSAALHHHLLHLPLGDFTEGTLPPMTDAKQELISLSMDSPSRFVLAFEGGDVEGFPGGQRGQVMTPCLSQDFFDLYCEWCRRQGLKALNQPRFVNAVQRKHRGTVERKRVQTAHPQRLIYLPGGHECPPDKSEKFWLTDRVEAFHRALRDYKGHLGGNLS